MSDKQSIYNTRQIKALKATVCKLNKKIEELEESGGTPAENDDPLVPESSSTVSYNVENYNSLLTTATNPQQYEFAYVREAQGTSWLPSSLGGTYYGRGLYMYDGSNWVASNENIYAALNSLNNYSLVNSNYTVLPE